MTSHLAVLCRPSFPSFDLLRQFFVEQVHQHSLLSPQHRHYISPKIFSLFACIDSVLRAVPLCFSSYYYFTSRSFLRHSTRHVARLLNRELSPVQHRLRTCQKSLTIYHANLHTLAHCRCSSAQSELLQLPVSARLISTGAATSQPRLFPNKTRTAL